MVVGTRMGSRQRCQRRRQRQLAQRLGVDEAQVSRDERNVYHGITLERAQRVLDALGAHVVTRVVEKSDNSEVETP